MLFNSYDFLIFLPILFLVYLCVPKKLRYIWLLIASYYFYMSWSIKYISIIMFTTIITWITGMLLYKVNKSGKKTRKKWILFISIAITVSLLGFFKYSGFIIYNINKITALLKLKVKFSAFNLVMPIGISFYTFQSLSYIIDIYRDKIEPEKNICKYALYVSFFPELVSGPIERAKNILPQIANLENIKLLDYERITSGLTIMLLGYFQKLVIADRVAILVNTVFDSYWMYGTFALFVAAIGYAVQIYCDFASYSNLAIGTAKILGINLMDNFNAPYFSKSISEFWHRWHISLSTWLRDYVYISLGGNRCSKIRKYFNIMVTFLVSGLWHGANWTFIIWGALHGLYQIIGAELRPIKDKINKRLNTKVTSISYRIGQVFITFILVDFAWIFFRSNSLSNAFGYIQRMFTKFDPWSIYNESIYTLGLVRQELNVLLIACIVFFMIELIQYIKKQNLVVFLNNQCIWFRWAVIILVMYAIGVYGIYGPSFNPQQFIYFQF